MLIFERSRPGRSTYRIPPCDVKMPSLRELLPERFLRKDPPNLPEIAEQEIIRHSVELSHKNVGVDTRFYPLGSCTMKYTPKLCEAVARFSGFSRIHPYQDSSTVQGILELLYELERFLCEIGGMDAITLQPAAGAHGELTALMMIRAYFRRAKERRDQILIPDSAHGTNPASSALYGFRVKELKTAKDGTLDIKDLQAKVDKDTAALMLTNPNTLGIFEKNVQEIVDILHKAGAFLYMDGANMNALLGITRPGDFGVDLLHFNLHKTFGAPHGGGGPGSGPVGVKKIFEPFLPVPRIVKNKDRFELDYDRELSIGKVRSFYGNISVLVKAYAYLRALGAEGLRRVAENAVLNANYLLWRIKEAYPPAYGSSCMHEFVVSAVRHKKRGVCAGDIAKRLLDYGFHPPTIYFPLIVPEALMIEPTETENKETLDNFANALLKIAQEDPEIVKSAPHRMPVRRLDEVKASRQPKVHAFKTI
jgi:glycine dehydrogenase subunit 2